MRCFDTFRWDETFAACTDEILAVCLAQSLANQIEILRAAELEKRTLHGFFFRRTGNVDRLAVSRVYTGVEHAGGKRAGRGVKILHLFGLMVDIAQVFRQLDGGEQVAARMAGNQVRDKVLFFAQFLIDALIFFTKRIVYVTPGLAHDGKNLRTDMLRRNLELTADMVLAKLAQESVGFIRHDIVIAQTGTHENLFDLRQRTDFAQQFDVIRMIDDHIRTGLRE